MQATATIQSVLKERTTAETSLNEGELNEHRHLERLTEDRSILEQFRDWAAANTYVYPIMSEEDQVVTESIEFISIEDEDDIYTALFNMLQAANRYRFNVDELLERIASSIPEMHEVRAAIHRREMSETYVRFFTELATYHLLQNRCEGIQMLLQYLDYSVRIHSERNIMECVQIFERFKHQAEWDEKLEFMDILGKSNLIQFRLEVERQRLHQMVYQYGGVRDPNVIRQSMVLDEMINDYNKLNTERKEKNPI